MASGIWSDSEPAVRIESVEDLERFVDEAEAKSQWPTAISVDAHDYSLDLLVGHEKSFVHLSPDDPTKPYFVTVGEPAEGLFDFWLHTNHHTEFENRHLIPKALAREAFREFFATGKRLTLVTWEAYFA